jgi:peptidoglycan hydrolase-like protein with peptidoglycan-binding domain
MGDEGLIRGPRGRCLHLAGVAFAALLLSAPAALAAGPRLSVSVAGPQRFERTLVMLAGGRVHVVARVRGAAPGSSLVVRFPYGGRELAVRTHRVSKAYVYAHDALRLPRAGATAVSVKLFGPAGETLARPPAVGLAVLQPTADLGAQGRHVRFLQRRLAGLHYAVRQTGRFDWSTSDAVMAFRKVNRMARVGVASRTVFGMVARGRGAFRPRRHGAAHVEGDLTRQVQALVGRGGRVYRVYTTSSGRPGLLTPTGVHRFYQKSAGWNSSGMLDSAYFTYPSGPRTACAIHGYFVVPTWNASHCCFRVPIPDARPIFNWVHVGQLIRVYY